MPAIVRRAPDAGAASRFALPSDTVARVRYGTRLDKPPTAETKANNHVAQPFDGSRSTAQADKMFAAGPALTKARARNAGRPPELGIMRASPPSHAPVPGSEIRNPRWMIRGPIRTR